MVRAQLHLARGGRGGEGRGGSVGRALTRRCAGPVEFAFSNLDCALKRYGPNVVTEDTLLPLVRFWSSTLSADNMRGYFQAAHYAVPGREYRPYL